MESIQNHIFLNEDKYNIGNNIYDFEILGYLGGGNNYHYAKVKSKLNNEIYVMKIMENIELDKYKIFEKNLYMLKLLEHQNMLKYYSSFVENNKYYIIMDYAEGGNLKNYIKIHKILDRQIEEIKLDKIFYELMSVSSYLDNEGFIHKNITTSNIFLTKDGDIKLGGLEYLFLKNDNIKELNISGPMTYELKNKPKGIQDNIYSLGLIFYNLRNLNPQHIFIPSKDNNKRIIGTEEIRKIKKNKKKPEYYMTTTKEESHKNNEEERDKLIIDNYNKCYKESLNSSIESVYFCLRYLFEHYCFDPNNEIIRNRKIYLNDFISNGPISQSLKITDLKQLRKILMENNKSFGPIGEISPYELIKFVIKQLHIENNFNYNMGQYYKLYSLEKNCLNRELASSEFNKVYNNYFNSVISDKERGLYGKYEIQNICNQCKNIHYYFESFYYITLDLDSTKEEVESSSFLNKNIDKITIYKFCKECKEVTKQTEIKSILELPCRLVILIKNNTNNTLNPSQTFKGKNYYVVAAIIYNQRENKYEYFHFIYGENGQRMKHNKDKKGYNDVDRNSFIALFYLYVGDKKSTQHPNQYYNNNY